MDQVAPRDIGDLAAYVPNFSSATVPSFKVAAFAMRGVGVSTIIPFNEAPVGVVFDDFVMPSIQTQLLDTFDLDQIEVLRGPQGTLFGKNTTGGAVVARSKRPELGEMAFQVRGEIGSFKTRVFQASANLPIGDSFALRLVGSYRKSDGYIKNGACYGPITPFSNSDFAQALAGATGCGDGRGLGGDQIFNGRAKLLWEPDPSVQALLQYEIVRDSGEVAGVVNATPPGFLYSNLGFPGDEGDPLKLGGLFGGNVGLVDLDKGMRVNVDGVYGNIDIDLGPGTLSSVSGYRSQRSRLPGNFGGEYSPIALYSASRDDNRRTFQQELRYAAEFSDRFSLVSGFFLQRDDINYCAPTLLGFLDLTSGPGAFGPNSENPQVNCNNQKSRSIALFTEGNLELTDLLQLTVGARYSWDRKKFAARAGVFAQQLDPDLSWQDFDRSLDFGDFDRFPTGVLHNKASWSDLTWRISLSYEATPEIFPYVTYARGYKAGGFNEVGQSGVALIQDQLSPYDPEKADSFELGLKSDFFDRMVRLNLAGFWVTYDDAQRQLLFPFIRQDGSEFSEIRFVNAAKVDVKGLEAELTVAPTAGLTLRGTLGYQDGKYKSFNSPTPTARELADAPLARTPKWQGSVSASYEIPLGGIGDLTMFGALTYTDRTLYNLDLNNPANDFYLDRKTLINASIAFTDVDDRYTIRLIGKNLTDELYFTGGQTVGALFRRETFGEPRYFGLELGLKY